MSCIHRNDFHTQSAKMCNKANATKSQQQQQRRSVLDKNDVKLILYMFASHSSAMRCEPILLADCAFSVFRLRSVWMNRECHIYSAGTQLVGEPASKARRRKRQCNHESMICRAFHFHNSYSYQFVWWLARTINFDFELMHPLNSRSHSFGSVLNSFRAFQNRS